MSSPIASRPGLQLQGSSGSFWPTGALQRLIPPAPAWLLRGATAQEQAQGLLSPLLQWQQRRLELVPDQWLQPDAKQRLVAQVGTFVSQPEHPMEGGFGRAVRAAQGDAQAAWFLEQGMIGWQWWLTQLRQQQMLPESPLRDSVARIEAIWQQEGPASVAAQLDRISQGDITRDPIVALYRIPLAVWHDRNADLAIRGIDFLSHLLKPEALRLADATWPLTMALVHAMRPDQGGRRSIEISQQLLDASLAGARPPGWVGLDSVEVRYQRARYLWDLLRTTEALSLLDEVIGEAPAYVLRALVDPAWLETNLQGQDEWRGRLQQRHLDASGAWTRWIQSGGGQSNDASPAAERQRLAQHMLQQIGGQPWVFMAAAQTLPRSGGRSGMSLDPQFLSSLERMREVLADLPRDLRVRSAEPRAAATLVGGAETELSRLDEAIAERHPLRLVELMDFLTEQLPSMLARGLLAQGKSQAMAVAAALEVLEGETRTDLVQAWGDLLQQHLSRCTEQIGPIRELGSQSTVGPDVARRVGEVWERFRLLDEELIRFLRRAFGQLQVVPAPGMDTVRVAAGRFAAARVMTQASDGSSIGAIPLVWRIVSGPAVPREGDELLLEHRAVSLKTGQAYLTISAPSGTEGQRGVVEVQLLDDPTPLSIPYEII